MSKMNRVFVGTMAVGMMVVMGCGDDLRERNQPVMTIRGRVNQTLEAGIADVGELKVAVVWKLWKWIDNDDTKAITITAAQTVDVVDQDGDGTFVIFLSELPPEKVMREFGNGSGEYAVGFLVVFDDGDDNNVLTLPTLGQPRPHPDTIQHMSANEIGIVYLEGEAPMMSQMRCNYIMALMEGADGSDMGYNSWFASLPADMQDAYYEKIHSTPSGHFVGDSGYFGSVDELRPGFNLIVEHPLVDEFWQSRLEEARCVNNAFCDQEMLDDCYFPHIALLIDELANCMATPPGYDPDGCVESFLQNKSRLFAECPLWQEKLQPCHELREAAQETLADRRAGCVEEAAGDSSAIESCYQAFYDEVMSLPTVTDYVREEASDGIVEVELPLRRDVNAIEQLCPEFDPGREPLEFDLQRAVCSADGHEFFSPPPACTERPTVCYWRESTQGFGWPSGKPSWWPCEPQ